MKQKMELYSEFKGIKNSKYENMIEYRPELQKLVAFNYSKKYSPHNWFYYKQGFSPKLVENFLVESGLEPGSWVLDPFCGVGTTLLVAKKMNFNCVGIDMLPLAVFVSKVKLRDDFDPTDIKTSLRKIIKEPLEMPKTEWPNVRIINKAFTNKRKNEILVYKERILEIETESTRELLFLCLLSILSSASRTKKDGGFLRVVKNAAERPLKDLFEKKVVEILKDLQQQRISSHKPKAIWKVLKGDARDIDIENNSIDCVITSPPYLNKTDYTRVYSLELCLAFVNSFDELKEIRYNSFRGNVEARYPPQNIILPSSLMNPLKELYNRKLSNPKHPEMIKGYFEDTLLSLKEMKRVLKPGGKIYFVIWNSCFSGINFDVDIISADIGNSIDLNVDKIIVVKQKGTSAQQSKVYGERPLRESIVVFSK